MRAVLYAVLAGVVTWPAVASSQTPTQEPRPTFKASVGRVAVAAVVRDRKGRPVRDLKAEDFQLFDAGEPRKIVEFRSDVTPVRLALLTDFSGSMGLGDRMAAAREITWHLLSWLTNGKDEIGLFAFDKKLYEVEPFAPAPGNVLKRIETLKPWGATSLFDAIAETGKKLAEQVGQRRAVVAMTDGADNASKLTPSEVSAIASSVDVPVYIILVISPSDRTVAGATTDDEKITTALAGKLGDLARWTGGEIYAAIGPADTSLAARQIVSELRHQYLIAFEPSGRPGWHPIDLRTRDKDLVVRARSGYVVRNGEPAIRQ